MLNILTIDPNIAFNTFQFIEALEEPTSRTSPKSPIVANLGVLLGGMFDTTTVLIRHVFAKKD